MMSDFDGTGFAELIIVVILVMLFVFGSTDIEGLSSTPTTT
ncbi:MULTISPECIES: hypothetical protein [unclassified Paenibacillus]|nr:MULTISPECIES: hypothetical protein [unclassified Paenibacillus]